MKYPQSKRTLVRLSTLFAALAVASCGGTEPASIPGSGGAGTGGTSAVGGVVGSGGRGASGGQTGATSTSTGGQPGSGGVGSAGTSVKADAASTGGSSSDAAAVAGGGAGSGGTSGTGGASASGGATGGGSGAGGAASGGVTGTGGSSVGSGGSKATGGAVGTGGTSTNSGGSKATGGAVGTGGTAAGTGGAATGGSTSGCPVELVGWATVDNGTTGGGTATPTTVTTYAAFKAAVQDSAARVVVVSGTIKTTDGDGYGLRIASNKTIIGANKSATIYGGLALSGVNNVIIRNLNIQGTYPNSGPGDTLASSNSHHVWYDHLAVWDADDGLLDITNQSNYHTVSWSKFYYTDSTNGHRLVSLNGSGGGDHPEDSRYLKSTYHHNWWSTLTHERMPRMMYGKLHAFNNYYNAPGNLYCIGVGSFGSALVENNYFKDVKGPHVFMYNWHMYIAASGNVYDNTTGNKDTGLGGTRDTNDPALNAGVEEAAAFTPPYKYSLDKAADVPTIVQKCAGPQ